MCVCTEQKLSRCGERERCVCTCGTETEQTDGEREREREREVCARAGKARPHARAAVPAILRD